MSPEIPNGQFSKYSTPYREAVGCLMYVMTMTRPDISFSVRQVSQFCQNPGEGHRNGVTRIFVYLSGTIPYGLCFDGELNIDLTGFTESDFAGNADSRRLTTGFIFTHNSAPVSWSSKLKQCVSLSTTEAEFIAASET